MGIQPKNTMRIAQRLYEAGHITYMRTDHAVLSEEAAAAARDWVREAFGEAFVAAGALSEAAAAPPSKAPKGKGKAKKSEDTVAAPQEAHEAIRPTHFETLDLPADEDWNGSDRKVYKLIWQRAVQSVMAASKGEQRTVTFLADGDPAEFEWRAVWRRTTFAGWRRVGAAATDLDAEEGDASLSPNKPSAAAWAAATQIELGTQLRWSSLEAAPHTSKAPGRYTEATLVRELEKRGIGRPSTFAQLVGTIMDKGYAEKRDTPPKTIETPRHRLDAVGQWPPTALKDSKKVGAERQKLAPTPLGLSVIQFLEREFDGLFAYEFTAQMEARLDAIAKGSEPWKALCRDTWASYEAKYKALHSAGAAGGGTAPVRERHFANGIKAVQSKKGPLLLKEVPGNKDATEFYGWPPGGPAFGDITEAAVAAHVAARQAGAAGEVVGTGSNGEPMLKKSGPFGAYVECGGVKVPWTAEDTEETLAAKLTAKAAAGGTLHTLGPFEFRKGPYGVYFFKTAATGTQRKFVGLPSGVDPKALTLEAATKLFQDGLQAKARGAALNKERGATGTGRGGRGGGRGGRGRGRGKA
jgi:DNA topoisomerase-1